MKRWMFLLTALFLSTCEPAFAQFETNARYNNVYADKIRKLGAALISVEGTDVQFQQNIFPQPGYTIDVGRMWSPVDSGYFTSLYGTGTARYANLNAISSFLLNGTNINTAGTLTNVAYENQANAFTLHNAMTTLVLDRSQSDSSFSQRHSVATPVGAAIKNTNISTPRLAYSPDAYPGPDTFEPGSKFSIGFWFNHENFGGGTYRWIISAMDDTTAEGFFVRLRSTTATTGYLEFSLRNTNTNSVYVRTTGLYTDAQLDGYKYYTVTYDGSGASGVRIYIDGVSQSLTTLSNNLTSSPATGDRLAIGAQYVGPGAEHGMIGKIGTVVIDTGYVWSTDDMLEAARYGVTYGTTGFGGSTRILVMDWQGTTEAQILQEKSGYYYEMYGEAKFDQWNMFWLGDYEANTLPTRSFDIVGGSKNIQFYSVGYDEVVPVEKWELVGQYSRALNKWEFYSHGYFSNNVVIDGNLSVGSLTLPSALTLSSLTVTGATSLNTLSATGNATFFRDLSVGLNATVGKATTDSLVGNGGILWMIEGNTVTGEFNYMDPGVTKTSILGTHDTITDGDYSALIGHALSADDSRTYMFGDNMASDSSSQIIMGIDGGGDPQRFNHHAQAHMLNLPFNLWNENGDHTLASVYYSISDENTADSSRWSWIGKRTQSAEDAGTIDFRLRKAKGFATDASGNEEWAYVDVLGIDSLLNVHINNSRSGATKNWSRSDTMTLGTFTFTSNTIATSGTTLNVANTTTTTLNIGGALNNLNAGDQTDSSTAHTFFGTLNARVGISGGDHKFSRNTNAATAQLARFVVSQNDGVRSDGDGGFIVFSQSIDGGATSQELGRITWTKRGAENTGRLTLSIMDEGSIVSRVYIDTNAVTIGTASGTGNIDLRMADAYIDGNDINFAGDGVITPAGGDLTLAGRTRITVGGEALRFGVAGTNMNYFLFNHDTTNDRVYIGFNGTTGGAIQWYANGTSTAQTHRMEADGDFYMLGNLSVAGGTVNATGVLTLNPTFEQVDMIASTLNLAGTTGEAYFTMKADAGAPGVITVTDQLDTELWAFGKDDLDDFFIRNGALGNVPFTIDDANNKLTYLGDIHINPGSTTNVTTGSTVFRLVNTTATTVEFAGAATQLLMGASTGKTTVRNSLSTGGQFINNGYVFERGIIKIDVADNTATNMFTITTPSNNSAITYSVWVKGTISHKSGVGATATATKTYEGTFSRVMVGGGTGVNSAVTELYESASLATDAATADVGTVTMTVVETSEYVQTIQFQVDLTGSSVTEAEIALQVTLACTWYINGDVVIAPS